jgi:hypothetical protein
MFFSLKAPLARVWPDTPYPVQMLEGRISSTPPGSWPFAL